MRMILSDDKLSMAQTAAELGERKIREAIAQRGKAVIALSTGLSQIDMLSFLTASDIPWEKVEAFHTDEYVHLPVTHPASSRCYLQKYFLDRTKDLAAFHAVDGNAQDIKAEISRLNALMADKTVDVSFIGIGENGHIAFNDPPADIDTGEAFIKVTLDERCRRQQCNEGWFPSVPDVPREAVTMSVRQIMKSRQVIATVPDMRKARAVAMCLFDEVSSYSPCAMLRWHADCDLCIDRQSAALVFGDRRSTLL